MFYDVTYVFYIVNDPTLNIFFTKFCEIKMEIDEMHSSKYDKKIMKENFDKYWNMCNLT